MSGAHHRGCLTKQAGLQESLAGNELFVYSETGEELLVLNCTALFVWSLCEDHSGAEILAILAELYPETAPGRLETDLRETLALFVRNGLAI